MSAKFCKVYEKINMELFYSYAKWFKLIWLFVDEQSTVIINSF